VTTKMLRLPKIGSGGGGRTPTLFLIISWKNIFVLIYLSNNPVPATNGKIEFVGKIKVVESKIVCKNANVFFFWGFIGKKEENERN
jgi:hypothetical protein